MKYQILQGDNRETLKTLADNSIDAIVTDPPYGIDFLGKSWDANTGALETYQECLRVLKPGGHILAFSAARTYHHLAVTLEQAGFEIRDQIMWIYSSGFPKSQDIGKSIDRAAGKKNNLKRHDSLNKDNNGLDVGSGVKCPKCHKDSAARYDCKENDCGMIYKAQTPEAEQWLGWGTALKPAHEPIALARKPIKLSIAKNAQKWGTGALNIDATRVETTDKIQSHYNRNNGAPEFAGEEKNIVEVDLTISDKGRFPSNVIGEIPDYQKYFYCPKVSRKERHIGYDLNKVPTIEHNDPATIHLHPLWTPAIGKNVYRLKQAIEEHNAKVPPTDSSGYQGSSNGGNYLEKKQAIVNSTKSMLETMSAYYIDKNGNPLAYEDRGDNPQIFIPGIGNIYTHGLKQEYLNWCKTNNQSVGNVGNNHPTVKPIALMKYLIKLITPPGGTVLDPFNGSGSTGCAAVELGYEYIGCELDPAYVDISLKRIAAWTAPETEHNNFETLFE